MQKIVPVSQDNYNKAAIKLLNTFLDMTQYEMDIIVGMLNNNITSLTRESRYNLIKTLNLKPMSFNNYIKKLKDKGTLMENGKGLILNPNIRALVSDDEISIIIKKNDKINNS